MKKMIVTDLDGTLLDSNRQCSNENIEYLKNLKEKGYLIVIATGRILASAIKATKGAEFADYIIADAGAVIYDVNKQTEVYKNAIDSEVARKVCSYCSNPEVVFMDLCTKDYYNKYSFDEEYEIGTDALENNIEYIDKFLDDKDHITHMTMFFNSNEGIDILVDILRKEIPELDYQVMKDSYRDRRWIEIVSKDITKYSAIKILSEIENINNENIIAFGDSYNDMDMIKNCGIGVAVANAQAELKEEADHITLSNDENGVIHFLKTEIELY